MDSRGTMVLFDGDRTREVVLILDLGAIGGAVRTEISFRIILKNQIIGQSAGTQMRIWPKGSFGSHFPSSTTCTSATIAVAATIENLRIKSGRRVMSLVMSYARSLPIVKQGLPVEEFLYISMPLQNNIWPD